ncbi:type II toxin-antitoxin system RelB/DinJ family antitoxin [Gardnerella piotii]|uniref:type II toxin-antitoxin system RelB/DinJ family antitoxin n=1 Tax=Gardnerella piotii TaxID=2792977 RepID=UPI0039EFAFC6
MTNTNAVYARIDTNLKENAESILNQLGITPSSAIQMLYSQIVLQNGMPFELRLPTNKQEKPLALGSLTRDELDKELQNGIDSLSTGKSYSANDVDKLFEKEYGV